MGGKASGKVSATSVVSSNGSKTRNHGNSYHPRDTPGWQKPITSFMKKDTENSKDDSIEDDEKIGGKRHKIAPRKSMDHSEDEYTEESEDIAGTSAATLVEKIEHAANADMDLGKEGKIGEEKTSKDDGKGKGKGKAADENKEENHQSDMEVENNEEALKKISGEKTEANSITKEEGPKLIVGKDKLESAKDKENDDVADTTENERTTEGKEVEKRDLNIEEKNEEDFDNKDEEINDSVISSIGDNKHIEAPETKSSINVEKMNQSHDKGTIKDTEKPKSARSIEDEILREENKENDLIQ